MGSQFINDVEVDGELSERTRMLVDGAIAAVLPPELRNRFDGIIIFRRLSRLDVRSIVDIRLREVQQRLIANGKRIKIQINDAAKDFIGSSGYSPSMGARPLQRTIQNELLSPLSMLILRGQIRDGETAYVGFNGPMNRLDIAPNHEAAERDMEVDDEDDDMEDEYVVEEDA